MDVQVILPADLLKAADPSPLRSPLCLLPRRGDARGGLGRCWSRSSTAEPPPFNSCNRIPCACLLLQTGPGSQRPASDVWERAPATGRVAAWPRQPSLSYRGRNLQSVGPDRSTAELMRVLPSSGTCHDFGIDLNDLRVRIRLDKQAQRNLAFLDPQNKTLPWIPLGRHGGTSPHHLARRLHGGRVASVGP